MTTVGFDQPPYVLPFDHRGSFRTKLFGWNGALSPEKTRRGGCQELLGKP